MNFRTDLALEMKESLGAVTPKGVESKETQFDHFKITHIRILDQEGAKSLSKPVGCYVTIESEHLLSSIDASKDEVDAISKEVISLLPTDNGQPVLVVGLGNREITPDALGPEVCDKILATRHIGKEVAEVVGLSDLRKVAVIAPGVLGQTGVESSEIILSLLKSIHPCAVVVVDALAAKTTSRLGTTIQIADCGISPGSGVNNNRREISQATLGVPVISIGIPTVVDATTLADDILPNGKEKEDVIRTIEHNGVTLMVTPKEIDLIISRAAKTIALAINKALQPFLSLEEIELLIS